jgi:hypothetical protein
MTLCRTDLKSHFRSVGVVLLTVAGFACAALPLLRVRAANPRLIEDANGAPFFMAGDCPQNMMHALSYAEMDAFFANRQAKGCNIHWVCLTSEDEMGTQQPIDHAGNNLKLNTSNGWWASNMNPAYWASVDSMIAAAERHNQYLFCMPNSETNISRPNCGAPSSAAEARDYGRFVGGRLKKWTNVNFIFGNDYFNAGDNNVALGILDSCPNRLMTINCSDGVRCVHQLYEQGYTWLNVNLWYTYAWDNSFGYDTIAIWTYKHVSGKVMPMGIAETDYDSALCSNRGTSFGTATPHTIRWMCWMTVLDGGSGWGITEGQWLGCNALPPAAELNSQGASMMKPCVDFFTSRNWQNLIPDSSHAFVTAGWWQNNATGNRVHAALTADHTFGAAYIPAGSNSNWQITVDMSKMAASTTARWYDPTGGTYKAVTGSPLSNAGSHVFPYTDAGANSKGQYDWVLVLETNPGTALQKFLPAAKAGLQKTGTTAVMNGKILANNLRSDGKKKIAVYSIQGRKISNAVSPDGSLRPEALSRNGIYIIRDEARQSGK